MSMKDLIYIPVVLVMVGLVCYVGWTVLDEYNTAIVAKGVTYYDATYVNDAKDGIEVFDTMIIFILVSIGVGAIALAAQLRTHPVFGPLALIVGSITIMFSAIIANVFYDIYSVPDFTNAVNEMDTFVAVNLKLPMITAALAVAIFIALYGKQFFARDAPL